MELNEKELSRENCHQAQRLGERGTPDVVPLVPRTLIFIHPSEFKDIRIPYGNTRSNEGGKSQG